MMKKVAAIALAGFLLLGAVPVQASTGSTYVKDILTLQPGVTLEELQKQVEEIAFSTGMEEAEVYEKMYREMAEQDRLGGEEAALQEKLKAADGEVGTHGGAEASYIVGASAQGDFYYTPSATAYINHGHVGLYYSSGTIVESIYPSGVRKIAATVRTVDKGAVVKSVTTSATNKANAANWAYGEIGQPYSLNFANNRNTGHSGAKNCSKLIWSAYLLNGGLDLDVDKGLGVYPRDVRDAPQTSHKRTI